MNIYQSEHFPFNFTIMRSQPLLRLFYIIKSISIFLNMLFVWLMLLLGIDLWALGEKKEHKLKWTFEVDGFINELLHLYTFKMQSMMLERYLFAFFSLFTHASFSLILRSVCWLNVTLNRLTIVYNRLTHEWVNSLLGKYIITMGFHNDQ